MDSEGYEMRKLLTEAFRRRELREELVPQLEAMGTAELARCLAEERVFREKFGVKFNDPDYCREVALQVLESKKLTDLEEHTSKSMEIQRNTKTISAWTLGIAAVTLIVTIVALVIGLV